MKKSTRHTKTTSTDPRRPPRPRRLSPLELETIAGGWWLYWRGGW